MDWSTVRHFTRAEFKQGNPGVEPDPELVRMLDEARRIAGVPFVIESGLRTTERNAQVGGANESAHLTGHAVDIRCPTGRHRFLIVQAALEVGFRRIGVANSFIHLDNAPHLPQDVIWTYR